MHLRVGALMVRFAKASLSRRPGSLPPVEKLITAYRDACRLATTTATTLTPAPYPPPSTAEVCTVHPRALLFQALPIAGMNLLVERRVQSEHLRWTQLRRFVSCTLGG